MAALVYVACVVSGNTPCSDDRLGVLHNAGRDQLCQLPSGSSRRL